MALVLYVISKYCFKKRSYVVGLMKWHSSRKEALLSQVRSRVAIDG